MVVTKPELAFINGQLKAWEYANRKRNYGIEFYLRDMGEPFRNLPLKLDSKSIISSFEHQLLEIVPSGTPGHVEEFNLVYTTVEWDAVENAIQEWVFKYVNDSVGHRLNDPTNAFESTDPKFQQAIARELSEQIKFVTRAQKVQMVENSSDYFSGFVILFESTCTFYELRIGAHF